MSLMLPRNPEDGEPGNIGHIESVNEADLVRCQMSILLGSGTLGHLPHQIIRYRD
jgi:hypothetical protein